MEQAVKLIRDLYKKGNFEEAIKQAGPILENRERKQDEYDFDNVYQQLLFVYGFSFGKADLSAYPYGELAMILGASAIEKGRYLIAKSAFELALEWNPVSVSARLYLSEVYKKLGDKDMIRENTLKALPFCYTGGDLSRCYRNFGYLALGDGNHTDAANFYYSALAFGTDEDEKIIRGELTYITATMRKVLKEPTPDEVLELFSRYEIPFGFHPVHKQLCDELKKSGEEKLCALADEVLCEVAL